jgi:hypothetical protein
VPKNEDGQFELTLGNRQLLSVFFIVVILLGVFFTMGYIVGKNSAPLTTEVATTRNSKPIVVDSPSSGSPSNGSSSSSSVAVPVPVVESPGSSKPEPIRTEPAKPEPVKRAVKEEKVVKEEKKEEKKAEKKTEKKAEGKAEAKTESARPGQSYLQLAATGKREADVMIEVLKQKGFSAIAAEIPEKPNTFRVLVGPIPEGGTNKMRADLQAASFPGNAAIRRTF